MSDGGESTWSNIRSAVLIAVVTVLVWLLAESESLRTEKMKVEIVFRADAVTNRQVRVPNGQEFTGSVSVRRTLAD